MIATGTNRFWSTATLILVVVAVPFVLARTFFDVNQFEIFAVLALAGLLLWLVAQGAGWRRVERGAVVIRKGPGDEIAAFWRKPQQPIGQMNQAGAVGRQQRGQSREPDMGTYLYVPTMHFVEAVLPAYSFGFEVIVENIDTQTAGLSRIDKIRVHVDCKLLYGKYLDFYVQSSTWLDRIKHYEENEKLSRTMMTLWKKLLRDIAEYLIDNAVREVVWKWSEQLKDQQFVDELSYRSGSDKGPDVDPYSLSRNRLQLERQVMLSVRGKAARLGIELGPLVFELIEIDSKQIERVNRNRDNELKEANHKALLEAEAIRQKGFAEAEVRAKNLALLLDELLNNRNMTLKDPLVTDIVRAALYSDGEMIWKGVLEKSANGDGTAKTA